MKSLEATRFVLRIIRSLWNLTAVLSAYNNLNYSSLATSKFHDIIIDRDVEKDPNFLGIVSFVYHSLGSPYDKSILL